MKNKIFIILSIILWSFIAFEIAVEIDIMRATSVPRGSIPLGAVVLLTAVIIQIVLYFTLFKRFVPKKAPKRV